MLEDDDVGSVVTFSDDVSEAEAPLPIPAGVYPATIRDVRRVLRQKSGKKGVDVYIYIKPEDYPANYPVDEAPDGTTLVYRRLNLEDTKQGRFALKRFVTQIGAPPIRQQIDDETLSGWKGLTISVLVKHGDWEGNPKAEVDRIVAAA